MRDGGQMTETRELSASADGATRKLKLTWTAPETFAVACAPPTRSVQVRAPATRTVKVRRAPGRTSLVSLDGTMVEDSACAAAGNTDAHAATAPSPSQRSLLRTIPMDPLSAPDVPSSRTRRGSLRVLGLRGRR